MDPNLLLERIREYYDKPFLIHNEKTVTYGDLNAEVEKWKVTITELGIEQGNVIAIVGDYSPNIVFLFIALILNKNIIVPMSNETREKHEQFLNTTEANGFFIFSDQENYIYRPLSTLTTHTLLRQLQAKKESGIIIFTSGTTGVSKAAVHQTAILLEKYKTRKRGFRTLIFLKLDHIGGINTLFSILFNGGTIVITQDRSVQEVCKAIEKYMIELLPTSPSFLNMIILSNAYREFDLSSLSCISYGTEPMPLSTLNALNKVFHSVTFKQTYGLTELGIFGTKSRDSQSTWMKVGGDGVSTKIIDNILWVKSQFAMLGYLNAPSPFSEDGWYNTGDEVEINGDYIRILGRKEDIINVGGEKVYPLEVENIILELPNIKNVLVCGKKSPIMGQIVTATVVLDKPEDSEKLQKRVITHCRKHLEAYKVPVLLDISDKEIINDRFKKMRNLN